MYLTYEELKGLIKWYQQKLLVTDESDSLWKVDHVLPFKAIPGQVFVDLEREGIINTDTKDWVLGWMDAKDKTCCFNITHITGEPSVDLLRIGSLTPYNNYYHMESSHLPLPLLTIIHHNNIDKINPKKVLRTQRFKKRTQGTP